ncbi:MAG TPA: hypothetical protein VNE83_05390 [Terriglobales bacterium]|nr:hypothetical protein [Terriglobales bacterium]
MTELPFPTGWIPWPRRLYPGRARRIAALGVGVLALAGVLWTLVVWRADAGDRHRNYAAAVFWRPDVAVYRRHWGEALLLTAPARAETQLLAALRLDPYDPLTIADLTTAELALGNWPQAVVVNQARRGLNPDFTVYWRLANLWLAHRDVAGYWQQFRLAAALALPRDFAPLVSRSLTATNNDFASLRRALPQDSVPAASAYLAAAAAAGNLEAVNNGAAWLAALPLPATSATTATAATSTAAAARRQAMTDLLLTAWRRWPGDVPRLGAWAAAMGVLPLPAKTPAPPYIRDADFNPADYAAARRLAPNPASELSAVLGWQTSSANAGEFEEVLTGDAAHPSAAEVTLDGSQPDRVTLAQQWLLVNGGAKLAVSVSGRLLDAQSPSISEPGLSLQLIDQQQRTVAELPLSLELRWRRFPAVWPIPGSGVQALHLELAYHRPNGHVPMHNRALITALSIQ